MIKIQYRLINAVTERSPISAPDPKQEPHSRGGSRRRDRASVYWRGKFFRADPHEAHPLCGVKIFERTCARATPSRGKRDPDAPREGYPDPSIRETAIWRIDLRLNI